MTRNEQQHVDLEDAAMTLAKKYSIALNDARDIVYDDHEREQADCTAIESLAAFAFCPICGEPVDRDETAYGRSTEVEATCPIHGVLVFPNTDLRWRPKDE